MKFWTQFIHREEHEGYEDF